MVAHQVVLLLHGGHLLTVLEQVRRDRHSCSALGLLSVYEKLRRLIRNVFISKKKYSASGRGRRWPSHLLTELLTGCGLLLNRAVVIDLFWLYFAWRAHEALIHNWVSMRLLNIFIYVLHQILDGFNWRCVVIGLLI